MQKHYTLGKCINLATLVLLICHYSWHIHFLWLLPIVILWLWWVRAEGICQSRHIFVLGCIGTIGGTFLMALTTGWPHRLGLWLTVLSIWALIAPRIFRQTSPTKPTA